MKNKIVIRKALKSESQQVRLLENKIWNEDVVGKYEAPMLVRFGWTYVALDKNKLIGAIIAYATKDSEVYVADWVVDKKYRGQKIGEKLYKKLLSEVGNKTIVSFIDMKNKASIEAHKKMGFDVSKKVKHPYDLNEGNRIFARRKKS